MSDSFISIFEFNDQSEIDCFYPIDDRVMGGVSSSALISSENSTAKFSGTVSFENSGGFASVRAALNCPVLSDARGITLRIQGDGKRYRLRLFNSLGFDSVAYEAPFVSSSEGWIELELPFSSFNAVWRGKPINNARAFDKDRICALGLMISEKQVGVFRLCLDWIRTY